MIIKKKGTAMKKTICLAVAAAVLISCAAQRINRTAAVMSLTTDKGPGKQIGTVVFADTDKGLEITTDLKGLPKGIHGFHVHENPDCAPAKGGHAMAAGGHFDPGKTGKHLGPGGGGHKGDLPRLVVGADGTAKETMYLPGVKAADFYNRSLMIHAGGDNYKDTPKPLGGGGARIACGLIE